MTDQPGNPEGGIATAPPQEQNINSMPSTEAPNLGQMPGSEPAAMTSGTTPTPENKGGFGGFISKIFKKPENSSEGAAMSQERQNQIPKTDILGQTVTSTGVESTAPATPASPDVTAGTNSPDAAPTLDQGGSGIKDTVVPGTVGEPQTTEDAEARQTPDALGGSTPAENPAPTMEAQVSTTETPATDGSAAVDQDVKDVWNSVAEETSQPGQAETTPAESVSAPTVETPTAEVAEPATEAPSVGTMTAETPTETPQEPPVASAEAPAMETTTETQTESTPEPVATVEAPTDTLSTAPEPTVEAPVVDATATPATESATTPDPLSSAPVSETPEPTATATPETQAPSTEPVMEQTAANAFGATEPTPSSQPEAPAMPENPMGTTPTTETPTDGTDSNTGSGVPPTPAPTAV